MIFSRVGGRSGPALLPPMPNRHPLRATAAGLAGQLAWHVIVLAAIIAVPASLIVGVPPWELPKADALLVAAMAGAYLVAAVLPRWIGIPRFLAGSLFALAFLGLIYLGILLRPSLRYSQILLLGTSLLVVAGTLAGPLLSRLPGTFFRLLRVTLLAAVAGSTVLGLQTDGFQRGPQSEIVQASQQILSVDRYAGYLPKRRAVAGGAIVRAPDAEGYLLVTGQGEFYRVYWDKANDLHVLDLRLQAPINRDEFAADATN
ncbi:MAG TPA: hypothetical protein VLC53_10400, partial [Myxococcota bacterium]|nr:hypothetical protein [Myxococcota bacterium]